MKGDLNQDGEMNLFDILRCVDIILDEPPPPSPHESWAADLDENGEINLFDILLMVDALLET
jgi:hypothetical protein